MGKMMLAVSVTRPGTPGRQFRSPSPRDLAAVEAARVEVVRLMPHWEIADLVPTEPIDVVSNYDRGHRMYGICRWSDFFTDRQRSSTERSPKRLASSPAMKPVLFDSISPSLLTRRLTTTVARLDGTRHE